MKYIALSLAALGIWSLGSAPAEASDLSLFLRGLSYGGHHIARENHAIHHDDLEHRAVHRELDHREAHRYPMSYRQHGRLHDALDHEAYHDAVEHRVAHRTRAYSPYSRVGPYSRVAPYSPYGGVGRVPQRGVGCYSPGVYFSFGR